MTPGPIRPGSAGDRDKSAAGEPTDATDDEMPSSDADEEIGDEVIDVGIEEEALDDGLSADGWADKSGVEEESDGPVNVAGSVDNATAPRKQRFSAFHRLYYGETRFEFVRRSRVWFAISAIVIIAGVASLATRGLNLSIDFVGGTSWQVAAPTTLSLSTVEKALPSSISGATVTFLGSKGAETLNVDAKLAKGESSAAQTKQADSVAAVLAKVTGHNPNDVSISSVGPSWGSEITHKAVVALIVFFILIALYISIFFEWRMAFAAIIAVIHDIVVTVGIYSLSFFLVTPDTVVAFLTILGYSLYDTIVVFDRVRANIKGIGAGSRLTITDIVNLSMNQTLARSMNTSLVAIMPILAVLVLGADILGATTLQYFGLALLVGLTTGAYSSLFIASPIVALMKEREQRWTIIRERLIQRGGARVLLSAAAVAGGAYADAGEARTTGRQRRGAPQRQAGSGPLRPGNADAAAEAASVEATPATTNGSTRTSAGGNRQQGPRRPPARNRRKGGRR